jgi:hypothetical protein
MAVIEKRGVGRPKLLTPCPFCRREFGVVQLREHLVECRKAQAKKRKS